jgi:small subunit ribosomal protein S15
MPLDTQVKKEIITKYRIHGTDVGSTEVQIAVLSRRILDLTEHIKEHRKDFSSRRGLLTMVSRRRRLLRYLGRESSERYRKLIKDLGLRG